MEWVLFDMNGTLLDPRAVGRALSVTDGEEMALGALDDAVVQAMTDTISGAFRPFPSYLEAALQRRVELAGGSGVAEAMEAAAQMPAFDESARALEVLKGAGLRIGVLTNSATDSARNALTAAGLDGALDAIMGADAVGAYKPDARVYEHALAEVGAEASQTCLVAAHAWDITGAHRAGLKTAWVARKERVLLATVPEPDFRGDDVESVARAIVA